MLDSINSSNEIDGKQLQAQMLELGRKARKAANILATIPAKLKNTALINMSEAIKADREKILHANAMDMENGRNSDMTAAFLDRLKLDNDRIGSMADGLKEIAELDDPVSRILAQWDRPNGLNIKRVSTPLGVIGVIYESRPNVTADAGALCFKAGNAVILRGGSDSYHTSRQIHACMTNGLKQAGLPEDAIQMVPSTDRAAVGEMLKGLDSNIDVIVPRGGKGLVARVQEDARVPVFAHLEGLCHVYIDQSADLQMAIDIVINSKMRRTGICGSAETLLIDKNAIKTHLCPILDALVDAGCLIRADETIQKLYENTTPATSDDWTTEYLDTIITAGIVDGVEGAVSHINQYSSNHTEAIVCEDLDTVATFFNNIDSAILLHNASTQFADGGEFGMGAEIGIATGKMHARGPVGVEQLTSFKYLVDGAGQTRP
ncbi:MAG: glutamate-5-semialdehyde dehydrogenase [Hyphomicrobiales bacterium]|nr:glutamate-5-semialdehyde dehydrogenase [Hyphomicrobiales bacterium]